MSMTEDAALRKCQELQQALRELKTFVQTAAQEAMPVHEVERGLWTRLLALGRQTLPHFFDLLGSGCVTASC